MKIKVGTIAVEEEKISPEEFYTKYIKTRTPVVLKKQIEDWPCVKLWSVDYFEQKFAELDMHVARLSATGLSHPPNYEIKMKGAKFFELVREQDKPDYIATQKPEHIYYMQQVPVQVFGAELKNDYTFTNLFDCSKESIFGASSVFLGSTGIRTTLHYDRPRM